MVDRRPAWMRVRAFLRKEFLQIRRDPSSILLAIVMPVALLFIFGYGVSLDPKNVPIAIVLADPGPPARDLVGRFEMSDYFEPLLVPNTADAVRLMDEGRVDAMLHIREDFTRSL